MTHSNRRHLLIMVLCCLVPLAAWGAIRVAGIPAGRVLQTGLFLLCPLSHVLMMLFMGRRDHEHPSADSDTKQLGVGRLLPEARPDGGE